MLYEAMHKRVFLNVCVAIGIYTADTCQCSLGHSQALVLALSRNSQTVPTIHTLIIFLSFSLQKEKKYRQYKHHEFKIHQKLRIVTACLLYIELCCLHCMSKALPDGGYTSTLSNMIFLVSTI
jgi:hypothetical protein